MAGNSFGELFRITTFGESHGECVGVVIDGCPPGVKLSEEDVQKELDRRKPGQSDLTTPRNEGDKIKIMSGVFEGVTTGTPIMMLAINEDSKSKDYEHLKNVFRPSHADYTYFKKYGVRDYRGGGRSSARVTLAIVAAGAVAKKYLDEKLGVEVLSYVEQVGDLKTDIDYKDITLKEIEANPVRCPDAEMAEQMSDLIKKIKGDGDSIGGVVKGVLRGVPAGLGEPIFDKLSADLGKAMLAINAVKGFEIGSGFEGVRMRGSEHNDEFFSKGKEVHTKTNNAGGVLGGISDGEDIYFRVAFKPVATIMKEQHTVNTEGENTEMRAYGRHDACVLPRAVPIVDAMSALVLMDHYLRHQAQCG